MNEQDMARKIVHRLQNPNRNPNMTVFTLPEPTREQVLDWIELQRPAYWLAVFKRRGEHYASGCQTQADADRYQDMLDFVQTLYEAGDIDLATYERLTDPHREPDRALWSKVKRWRPSWVMNTTNPQGELVGIYQMIGNDGQPFDLTLENGIWYKHTGHAYSKW